MLLDPEKSLHLRRMQKHLSSECDNLWPFLRMDQGRRTFRC